MKETPVVVKSKKLALEIIKTYKYLCEIKHEYIMSKQLLRAGTSVGANVKEAVRAYSDADMYAKFSISQKEASETEYWLELLKESEYLDERFFLTVYELCQENLKILTTIMKKRLKP